MKIAQISETIQAVHGTGFLHGVYVGQHCFAPAMSWRKTRTPAEARKCWYSCYHMARAYAHHMGVNYLVVPLPKPSGAR